MHTGSDCACVVPPGDLIGIWPFLKNGNIADGQTACRISRPTNQIKVPQFTVEAASNMQSCIPSVDGTVGGNRGTQSEPMADAIRVHNWHSELKESNPQPCSREVKALTTIHHHGASAK